MHAHVKRVYVDTSVVGGAFATKFAWQTKPFWDAVRNSEIIVIASDILRRELEGAPQHIQNFFHGMPTSHVEQVVETDEANALAKRYIAEKVVGQSSLDDCKHIAIATIAHADCLVSWNFKHIVNVNRIRGYNNVNAKLGYPQIDIRTPDEVINDRN